MTKQFCRDCRFAVDRQMGERDRNPVEIAICHGGPPSQVINPEGRVTYGFPLVTLDVDWCGRFEPLPAKSTARGDYSFRKTTPPTKRSRK